jgi:hypothetical protein
MMFTKQRRLEEATFLRSLSEDLDLHNQRFLEAWPVLMEYHDIPKVMAEEEWHRVANALTSCYGSVRFLVRIARLVKAIVIDRKLLYTLYYDEVTGYLTRKLSFLIQWCGTGLDLAADYDSYELARIIPALMDLLKELNSIHHKNGADLHEEGHEVLTARFEDRARNLLADLGRFSVGSDNYIGNYIEIEE